MPGEALGRRWSIVLDTSAADPFAEGEEVAAAARLDRIALSLLVLKRA
jgi:hypothetical protein